MQAEIHSLLVLIPASLINHSSKGESIFHADYATSSHASDLI